MDGVSGVEDGLRKAERDTTTVSGMLTNAYISVSDDGIDWSVFNEIDNIDGYGHDGNVVSTVVVKGVFNFQST